MTSNKQKVALYWYLGKLCEDKENGGFEPYCESLPSEFAEIAKTENITWKDWLNEEIMRVKGLIKYWWKIDQLWEHDQIHPNEKNKQIDTKKFDEINNILQNFKDELGIV